MKRLVSCLMAALLVLALSVPAYAADGDTVFIGNFDELTSYLQIEFNALFNKMFTLEEWNKFLKNNWYDLVTDLSDIFLEIQAFHTHYLEDSAIFGEWHKEYLQAGIAESKWMKSMLEQLNLFYTSATSQLASVNTYFTQQQLPALNTANTWLESANGYLNTIDSSASALRINSDDLKTGWFVYPQLQRPTAKAGYQNSWYFGVLQSLYNFRSEFAISQMNKSRVEGFKDSDFSHLTFAEGIYSMLYRLQQVLADDDDLQMRQDSEENKNVAKDAFLSYDSDTSVKPSDIGGLSNLGSGLRNNFDTGTVEASNLFDFWGSDNTFSWFTQETKDNMVNVSSSGTGVRRARAQNDEPIYYSPYGEHMEEYERLMREGIK